MNKAELIAAMAAKTGETKKQMQKHQLNAFVRSCNRSFSKKRRKVQLVGFGSFEVRKKSS